MTFDPITGYHETVVGPTPNTMPSKSAVDMATKTITKFKAICMPLRRAFVDFVVNADSNEGPTDERVVRDNTEWDDTTAVSSEITSGPYKGDHVLMLDLDVPHVYYPSSTPGHGHLIVNAPMSKGDMLRLLDKLSKHGIIEPGYAHSAVTRQAAWLRVPWHTKETAPQ